MPKTEGEEIRDWKDDFMRNFTYEYTEHFSGEYIKDFKTEATPEKVAKFIRSLLTSKAKEVCERLQQESIVRSKEDVVSVWTAQSIVNEILK